jgi:ubiquinone/menaquinone biosynthesis C-methylase UbiE
MNFAEYKDSYRDEVAKSIAFIGQDVDFFMEVKVRYLLDLARRRLGRLSDMDVLDIGCGVGSTDRHLAGKVGRLHGVDIPEEVLERARENVPEAEYRAYDGRTLPYPDNRFDLAFAINVMHHVPPAQWPDFVREMTRVVRPGGLAVVFEHNPYNPLTRRAVRECSFDADAVLLPRVRTRALAEGAGLRVVETRYILFTPFRGGAAAWLDRRLGLAPIGAQYYLAARKSA